MSVSKEDSEIKIDPKYDIIVRPIIANKEVTVDNPFNSENVTTTQNVNSNDDLPF